MRTAAYYRRSTTLQDNSLSMQQDRAFKTALGKKLIIDHEFVDDAISARKKEMSERKDLEKLLDLIERDKVKTLLVYKRDRLARKAIEYLKMYRLFKAKDVNVIFTSDGEIPINYSPIGELIENLMAALIEHEGNLIVERIRASIEASFRNGKNPGTLPFGYSITGTKTKEIVRHEDELELMKTLYDMCEHGHSLKKLSEYAKTVFPARKWTPSSVRNLLQNPTYMGLRILKFQGSAPIPQEYSELSIIDGDRWETIFHLLESQVSAKTKILPEQQYLLTGLLYCKDCNVPLQGKARTRKGVAYPEYHCPQCKKTKVDQQDADKLILDKVSSYLKSLVRSNYGALVRQSTERAQELLQKRIKKQEKERDKSQRELLRGIEDWAFGQMADQDRADLEEILLSQAEEMKLITNELDELEEQQNYSEGINDEMKLIREKMKKSPPRELLENTQILKQIIARIDIDECFLDITFNYPFAGIKEAHSYGVSS